TRADWQLTGATAGIKPGQRVAQPGNAVVAIFKRTGRARRRTLRFDAARPGRRSHKRGGIHQDQLRGALVITRAIEARNNLVHHAENRLQQRARDGVTQFTEERLHVCRCDWVSHGYFAFLIASASAAPAASARSVSASHFTALSCLSCSINSACSFPSA